MGYKMVRHPLLLEIWIEKGNPLQTSLTSTVPRGKLTWTLEKQRETESFRVPFDPGP